MRNLAFGLISGVCNSLGLVFHIIVLIILLIIGTKIHAIAPLIVFTIVAKIFSEWLFWDIACRRMNSIEELKNWKSALKSSIIQPNVMIALFMLFADNTFEAALIFTALKTSISPVLVFLLLFGCQALASPIQGFLLDFYGQRKSLIFASFMALIILTSATTLHLNEKTSEYSWLMPCLLCCKGLLVNLTTIARAVIADGIKFEAVKKYNVR